MEFQDVTNEQVDKTIYTNDLDTLITRQLKNGIYSVVHINSGIDDNTYGDAYTLTVGDGSISSRVLECRTGWAQTVLVDENYQWQWHRYSYNGHTHQMSDVEELTFGYLVNQLWIQNIDTSIHLVGLFGLLFQSSH